MKQLKVLTLLLAISFVLVLAGIAQQQSEEKVTCAVSGEVIKKSEAKATHEYKGKTYYFCCDGCKEAFVKSPEKYIQEKAHEGHMHAHGQAEDTAVDPVCGMKIKKSDAKATYEYNGETYYFCMEGCKEKFVENPGQYIKKDKETVTCPVSGKKVEKSKAAGSYEYKGQTYHFCCSNCKEKFMKNPEQYTKKKSEMEIGTESCSCATKK